ncbi:hypothetical protein ElyMa_006946900 [Elysia marginata]|uniref:Uncharacterized protein n=1 Tax=Elysia marginata TaxID=1093978 RepID=A0AAV4JHK4_9GAST|nr:hypothetical protein ElyMa_006946900 [Elysia marginata]
MKNSSCAVNKWTFRDMKKRFLECDGTFTQTVIEHARIGEIDRPTFIELSSNWTKCAAREAELLCGWQMSLYVDYISNIQTEVQYGLTQDSGCWELAKCDDKILGIDLTLDSIEDIVIGKIAPAHTQCSTYKDFISCYRYFESSCRDGQYKLILKSYVDILQLVCSSWGKQSNYKNPSSILNLLYLILSERLMCLSFKS